MGSKQTSESQWSKAKQRFLCESFSALAVSWKEI